MVLSAVTAPNPTKERKQRSLSQDDLYLTRYIRPWSRPLTLNADAWRSWIFNQPVAMICRETLIANFLSLEWKITARDSNQQDELKPTIKYYTKLLENGGNNPNSFGMDYAGMMEWILADLLDLPFGSGTELGRRDDAPGGRVLWMKPLDGGTLYPTLNKDYPVVQYYSTSEVIPFPAHAIARVYMSPRPEILREGWGLAPPEKVFLALEMLVRGDRYYANLLLDIPPAGILDLGDMEQSSALEWINAFKTSVMGAPNDSFKIPVLYEHTTKTEFIPFGKIPNDLMYDRITMRYIEMICASYGLSPSDIGVSATSNGGETLAGSIRQERKARRTGIGRLKRKVKGFMESILPNSLEFKIIDLDDELNVSIGRTRLSNATAWGLMIDKGIFTADEARLQTIADGIITINVPEAVPPEAKKVAQAAQQTTPRPEILGKPVPASSGGQGEIRKHILLNKSKGFNANVRRLVKNITKAFAPILLETSAGLNENDTLLLKSNIDESIFGEEDLIGVGEIIRNSWGKKSWLVVESELDEMATDLRDASIESVKSYLEQEQAYRYENSDSDDLLVDDEILRSALGRLDTLDYSQLAQTLVQNIQENLKSFIGKSVLYLVKEFILAEDMFDNADNSSYDNIVNQVHKSMSEKFDEFFGGCVELEIQNILDRIKLEALNG